MTLSHEVRRLVALALPVILAQLLTAATALVDTVMAGHAGVTDLAAVSLGSALWLTLLIAPMGLFMAVNPIVGQYAGAGRYRDITNFMHQALRVGVLVTMLVLAVLALRDVYLAWFIADPDILRVTSDYLQGFAWGVPALLATFLLRPYSEGLSFTRAHLVASLVSLVINVPANYALIFGHWGAPALGGAGAGWASAIALWAGFLVMLGYSLLHPAYRQAPLWQPLLRADAGEIRHLLVVGVPIALTLFVEVSIFSLIALFLGTRPGYEIAAHQVAMNVSYLAFTLPLGISVAATIRVSNHVGAGRLELARLAALAAVLLAIITACTNILLLVSFAKPIAWLYSNDAQVISLAAHLMLYAAMFQLADAFVVPTQGALRGYKDTRVPLLLAILAYWVVALPVGYLLGLTDWLWPAAGAEGFWISLVVGLVISGLLMTLRLLRIARSRLDDSAVLKAQS